MNTGSAGLWTGGEPPKKREQRASEAKADEMALLSESPVWSEIDLAESYLVCCMFEEAASLASSIIRQICNTTSVEEAFDNELAEVLESAGMVFVQSLKELGRTRELFVELEMLFGSVAEVPVQVFLIGTSIQISEGYSSNLRPVFEEFLGKWMYLGGEHYVLPKEQQSSSAKGCIRQYVMAIEKYLEVAEVYAITLLGMILHMPEIAISWTEGAELPEEKRQDILRRLRSLHLATDSSSSLGPGTAQMAEIIGNQSASTAKSALSRGEGFPKTTKPPCHLNGEESKPSTLKSIRPSIRRILDINPCFWWFRTVRLKFGSTHLVLPPRKIMLLGLLMASTFYILRKRSAVLKKFAIEKASSIRRALIDAWQLAFSIQVNPLAAVQQLPSSTPRGGR